MLLSKSVVGEKPSYFNGKDVVNPWWQRGESSPTK